MGMSPQTGLPHNNRVGDFDPFAIPLIMQADGQVAGPGARHAGREERACSGCRGISGDIRDLEEAAAQGNARAQLALDVFIAEIRRHLGGMLVELGGVDAIVFTGGIGENGVEHSRAASARTWKSWASCSIPQLNATAKGECRDQRRRQPRADLDRADERRTDRRPANETLA